RWLALLVLVIAATGALAQAFPSRAIRVVVPTTAGGVPDVLARAVGQRMSKTLGQPVVIENRAGAGGILAAEAVLKSPADGHTLFLGDTGNYAVSVALYASFPYDVRRDFAPVVLAAAPPVYLVANPGSPFTSVADFVRLAQSGNLIYGSTGNGNVTHLAMELLRPLTGAHLTHVPYKGAAGLLPALLSGDVAIGFIGYSIVAPHAKTGKLRVLAVSTSHRSSLTPDVPTVAEAGVPGYGFDISVGYLAPAGTPRAVIERLNAEINRALKVPEVRQVLETAGIPPVGGTPEAFAEAITAELALMREVVKAAGTKVD
ncbi:MAG: Bug family tripartite tricarboxylate transporter substrate binding protein, partial [Burkholderiales bacterium]